MLLSAMCVPDLRGTQGMFSYYTTRKRDEGEKIGGEVHHVTCRVAGLCKPIWSAREIRCSTTGATCGCPSRSRSKGADRAILKVGGESFELRKDVYTDWIPVSFRAAPGCSVRGVCKFLLLSHRARVRALCHADQHRPGAAGDAGGLSRRSIRFIWPRSKARIATLGLAEDTWALNEGVLNDDHFIQQCLDMDDEREAMFLDALDKVPRGLVACVFDGTDRLQHTFWRDIDETHPARPDPALLAGRNVIEDLYRRMDDLVGKTIAEVPRQGHDAHGHLRPWLRPVSHRVST